MADLLLLPGAVLPAAQAYPALVEALGDGTTAVAKELELYRADAPPAGYGLGTEVAGIAAAADDAGFERFHLAGYSAGGAAALAFAAEHGERLRSLTLMEPAWAGNTGLGPEEQAHQQVLADVMALPQAERMAAFVRAQIAPGVVPPPPPEGDPPPWMAQRPAGLVAVSAAFDAYELDTGALRAVAAPVLYTLGGLSHPDYYARQAERLSGHFRDFTLEVFAQRHHFDPPHRAEPERLAALLRQRWEPAG